MKEIKFEDLQKANETIVTTDVKGKQYAEVNQRIKAFRMVYPDGFIRTNMESNENGVCIFKAEVGYILTTITDNNTYLDEIILSTGTAYEKENSTFINKTSYIENCETSAVGRALGMAGFGIDTSVASAEEVQNAINNQNKESEAKLKLMAKLETLIMETETDRDKLYEYFKVTSNTEMTEKQLKEAVEILKKKHNKELNELVIENACEIEDCGDR